MERYRFNIFATGISLFVCLVWLTVSTAAPAIEVELNTAAATISTGEDLKWVTTAVDGDTLTMAGFVPDHHAQKRAARLAADIHGLSSIDNGVKLVGTEGSCQQELNSALSHEKIQFNPGSYAISSNSDFLLKMLAVVARNCDAHIRIAGHTDSVGDGASNQRLSQLRAGAVRKYLISSGVNANRLTAVGYGSSQPIYDNSTAEGRNRNRRIEFLVSINS